MTCIVGIIDKDNKKVIIGGDSAGVSGHNIVRRKDPKVFRPVNYPDFVIGCTTSFRMSQLLHFSVKLPKIEKGIDIYEYMCTTFIESVRTCFEKGGYMREHKEDKNDQGGVFLVGYKDRLFKIGNDFQVGESLDDYNACGCGVNYALGSFHATKDVVYNRPKYRVEEALEAAAYHSGGVEKPFITLTT